MDNRKYVLATIFILAIIALIIFLYSNCHSLHGDCSEGHPLPEKIVIEYY